MNEHGTSKYRRVADSLFLLGCIVVFSTACIAQLPTEMGISVFPPMQTICGCGGTATVNVGGCDEDICSGGAGVPDTVTITSLSGWGGGPYEGRSCVYGTFSKTFDNPGFQIAQFMATDKANACSNGNQENDDDVYAIAFVDVLNKWTAGPSISLSGIAAPVSGSRVCAGSEVTCSAATATDNDTKNPDCASPATVADTCTYFWTANGGTFKDGANIGQTVTWLAPPGGGVFTITVTVDDQNDTNLPEEDCGSRDDGTVTASTVINVCAVSVFQAMGRYTMVMGCGYPEDPSLNIECTLSEGCEDTPPEWLVTGPLRVKSTRRVDVRHYQAVLGTALPSGCSEPGTVQAKSGECTSEAITITTKKSGPFTITLLGSSATQCYRDGTRTFADIGMRPPEGCDWTSPVYGCTTPYHYQVCSECPFPGPTAFYESFVESAGCPCPPRNETKIDLNETSPLCNNVSDDYGVLTCNCNSDKFSQILDCKFKQQYAIGSCIIRKQCVHQVRSSEYPHTCAEFTSNATATEGWDDCDCE